LIERADKSADRHLCQHKGQRLAFVLTQNTVVADRR